MQHRYIGRFEGRQSGPLVIAIGAVHGNEPAGVQGITAALQWMEIGNKAAFSGNFVGLIGHCRAFQLGQRFLERDLNRMWTTAEVAAARALPLADRSAEARELVELDDSLKTLIDQYQPEKIVLIDLHTTSATGGIFTIPFEDEASILLARALNAPVIRGLLDGLSGTLLHYLAEQPWQDGWQPSQTAGLAFEAGQHNDQHSASHCALALMLALQACGCLQPNALQQAIQEILHNYQKEGLPDMARLTYVHHIQPEDEFVMRPGYENFQPVVQGEHLANDRNGPVKAPMSGLILMPLYQKKGTDGFFLVQPV
jgi:succinylglutamate desuccinylase